MGLPHGGFINPPGKMNVLDVSFHEFTPGFDVIFVELLLGQGVREVFVHTVAHFVC